VNFLLILRPDFTAVYSDTQQEISRILQTKGEVYRNNSGRKTLRFSHSGKSYFLKIHTGVGWKEIFKNLFQFRLPVISAKREWQALFRLRALGIDTLKPIGFGSRGNNPAHIQSFLITDDLGESITLEEFLSGFSPKNPGHPLEIRFKRALIRKVANIARTMHENGVNHRDFYLCHFRLPLVHLKNKHPQVHVMDLHRAQLRTHTPKRWVIKDLGGLYFSSFGAKLTQRDLFRFIRTYRGQPLRALFASDTRFWRKIKARAKRINEHHQKWYAKK